MYYKTARAVKNRIMVILALISLGAGAVVARGVQLQVLDAEKYRALAARQHQQTIEVKARRGEILDSNGEALALSLMKKTQVFARPEQIEDPESAAKALARVLHLSAKDRESLAKKLRAKDPPFIWVTRYAKEEQVAEVEALGIKGIGAFPAMQRFYPGGMLASNIIGFTGLEGNGLEGLEYLFEGTLAGNTIRVIQERDGRGNPIFISERGGDSAFKAGENADAFSRLYDAKTGGSSVKLTIHKPLQYLVERELEKGVSNARAKSGCIVAMEPTTGRVLAMASYPTFDPNNFRKFKADDFRNRCAALAYEPGSTFKVFVAAAALDRGAIGPKDRFFCENGTYALGGETISDVKAHGWLSVSEIIAFSSNIGASKIGERLGKEKLHAAIKAFGFGEKTGIDLPGEAAGLVREYKKWPQVAVGTISFGQGVSVTPLQMVTAVCAIANRGILPKPFLVESIVHPDGTVAPYHVPEAQAQVVSMEAARLVTGFMQKVTAPGATGELAQVEGYPVAGKTGTAQKAKENARGYADGKYVCSFLGFLPANKPALAMIVIIDEPDMDNPYGGTLAAPVFAAIAKQAMVLLKIPAEAGTTTIAKAGPAPESGAGDGSRAQWEKAREWNSGANTPVYTGAMVMPGLIGLTARQALAALKGKPVQVQVGGSGVVASQHPAPGSQLIEGQAVRINLEDAP